MHRLELSGVVVKANSAYFFNQETVCMELFSAYHSAVI